jgi:alkylation response protein AidB-like acyl-CoA dehydrogenase
VEFELTPAEREFRNEVCSFLRAELTPAVWRDHRDRNEQEGWSAEYARYFRRRLGDHGYISIGWPTTDGGGGKGATYQVLLAEELEYHRAPALDRSITYVPSALLQFGSAEQKSALLPRIKRGEIAWFVGYSEPEAGSDLASLKTQAVEDGDCFVITGQKAFSSDAHLADFGWVAARTGPSVPKHQGISVFVVDMKAPGVQVTHYPTMAGWTHHAVYFNHVRVPKDMLVGPLHGGWKVIMSAIDIERAALATPGLVSYQLDRLLAHCSKRGGLRESDDALVVDQLCRLAIEAEAARLMSYWVASLHARGDRPQFETSMALLYKRETARLFDVAGLEILGPYAPLRSGSEWAQLGGDIEAEYRDHAYFHFAAGGFDITRNVIASRGLGLPRYTS